MKSKLITSALILGVLFGLAGQTMAGGKKAGGGSQYCIDYPTAPQCAVKR